MKKIAIVTDSTISLTPEQIKMWDVDVIPMIIMDGDVSYLDNVTIDHEGIKQLLKEDKVLKTSQPNLGTLIAFLENIKEEHYDHIFILTVSSTLSGTYASVYQAIEEVGMDNVTLIDTKTVAGPVQQIIDRIRIESKQDISIESIVEHINKDIEVAVSYLYPSSLETLKRGGRISAGAATLASLFKIKPLLYLDQSTKSIDKMGTARTESKIFTMILEDMEKRGITPQDYDLIILNCDGDDMVDRFLPLVSSFNTRNIILPAVLAAHAGLGTIAVQCVRKVK